MTVTAELICGAVAFAYRSDLQEFVTENAAKLMRTYNESYDDSVRQGWDSMHQHLVTNNHMTS